MDNSWLRYALDNYAILASRVTWVTVCRVWTGILMSTAVACWQFFPSVAWIVVFLGCCSFQVSLQQWLIPSSILLCICITRWPPSGPNGRNTYGGNVTWQSCSWWVMTRRIQFSHFLFLTCPVNWLDKNVEHDYVLIVNWIHSVTCMIIIISWLRSVFRRTTVMQCNFKPTS